MNLERYIDFFKRNKLEWTWPRKVEVLIYGRLNSEVIGNYIGLGRYQILDENCKNIWVLLICALRGKIGAKEYIIRYIKATGALVAITSIDNDECFWSIKNDLPKVKCIVLQYAWHGEVADIFGYLKDKPPKNKFKLDYLFVYNRNIGKKYNEYIDAEIKVIGNFKNNSYFPKAQQNAERKSIAFISQYRIEQVYHPVFFYWGKKPYFRDSFYESERKLLPLLHRFCMKRGFVLEIIGHGATDGEKNFFLEMIGHSDWIFLPRIDPLDSYSSISRATVVVGVDSSLIYESFGRGLRTGIFSEREKSLKLESLRFGWPGNFRPKGPFWTNDVCEEEVHRVITTAIESSDLDWQSIHHQYREEIMEYDPGNTQLIEILKTCTKTRTHHSQD